MEDAKAIRPYFLTYNFQLDSAKQAADAAVELRKGCFRAPQAESKHMIGRNMKSGFCWLVRVDKRLSEGQDR